jgi:hypothetical protein
MSLQELVDSLLSYQVPFFGKVAIHDHPRRAQRLPIGARAIDTDTCLQLSEILCVLHYHMFWNGCYR